MSIMDEVKYKPCVSERRDSEPMPAINALAAFFNVPWHTHSAVRLYPTDLFYFFINVTRFLVNALVEFISC
jgi:hypothetical protein